MTLETLSVATFEAEAGIAFIIIDSPPVNALGAAVRTAIADGLARAMADTDIAAAVIMCGGRTFFAGADITEFGKPVIQPDLNALIDLLDGAPKPVIAAIHGNALGGGLELALACHARIAEPSAKLGLPEVNLGLLPGAGGTQRLPRLLGAAPALDLMLTGKPVDAQKALDIGLIDQIAQGDLRRSAGEFARAWLESGDDALRRVSAIEGAIAADRQNPEILSPVLQKHARLFRGFKAPGHIVEAVKAAIALPFDQGKARERALFLELLGSRESAAQRHAFFAERKAGHLDGPVKEARPLEISKVGVIGAGTMGGGIAMNFLDIGIPVTLVEANSEALERGLATIQKNYEISSQKGRMSLDQIEDRMALLRPALSMEELGDRDLVIEAVYEDLAVKTDIFAKLGAIVSPDAILASNTSFLDLDKIAAANNRPERVVGLHFFSPANVMRLLEVVRGEKTDSRTLATAMQLAKRIGKIAVMSGVCHGFIANRMMSRRTAQASAIILEGALPWDVDAALREFGFAMGPFEMMDLVGLDVVGWDREKSCGSSVQEILCEAGRWGVKRGAGYYDYSEGRKGSPSAEVETMITDFAARKGIVRQQISRDAILERLLFPVLNEGAKILEEGIAARASDIDTALVTGYGWPVFTGGPMFWADTIGLDHVVASLTSMEAAHGDAFAPANLLRDLAAQGKPLASR